VEAHSIAERSSVEILSNVRKSIFLTSNDSPWPPLMTDDAWSNWLSQFAGNMFRGVQDIGRIKKWSLGTYTPKAKGPVISEEDTPNAQKRGKYPTPLDFFEHLTNKKGHGSPDSLVLIAHVDESDDEDMWNEEPSTSLRTAEPLLVPQSCQADLFPVVNWKALQNNNNQLSKQTLSKASFAGRFMNMITNPICNPRHSIGSGLFSST
jgi:hypothetical protein